MIQKLLESSNPWRNQQKEAEKFARKWTKTGLLEGLKNDVEKNNMAMMLENQAKQLVIESSQTGAGVAGATFVHGSGEQWAGIALPMVRKIFGQISAKEFVSVQPMNLPSGLVFFLDFQYGTTKAPFTAGQSLYGNADKVFGHKAEGGLYGPGRFSYTMNNTSSQLAVSASATATWADFNFDDSFSASFGDYTKIDVMMPRFTNYAAARSFAVTQGGDAINLPAFTTTEKDNYTYEEGLVSFIVDSTFATGSNVTVEYSLQTKDNKRGDFEDGNNTLNENNTPISIPEINVKMKSEPIVARTRKLKAAWTPEFAQDLNAYQALDAEAELTSIMSEYIALEIDLEILDMLMVNAAGGEEIWSAKNNTRLSGTTFVQDLDFFNTQGGWFQTLGTKIQKLSNNIHQKTLRGGANFMVISPQVATIIEAIPGFASNSDGDAAKMKYAFGVQKSGQLQNKYDVFKNPYMQENVILLGFRGTQFLETGAVYAPYIPLIMTPLLMDPDTFTPRKGLITRYATKMLRPEFYAKIYVSGLNTI